MKLDAIDIKKHAVQSHASDWLFAKVADFPGDFYECLTQSVLRSSHFNVNKVKQGQIGSGLIRKHNSWFCFPCLVLPNQIAKGKKHQGQPDCN